MVSPPRTWLRRGLLGVCAFLLLFNVGGILMVRVQATAGDLRPTEEDLLTPPPFRVKVEDVSFTTADGVDLKGWFLPGSSDGPAAKRASVLLLSGSGKGGHPYAALTYGPLLVEAGYNVFAFSYRGHGRSGGSTFGGTLVSMERLVDDARAALGYLRSRPEVKDQPVGTLGCSLGTGVALGLAARTGELQALVLDSPWSDLPASQEKQAVLRGQGWQNRIPYFWHLLRWWASLAFQVDLAATEPMAFLERLNTTPVFLIHGTADSLLHPRQSETLYTHAPGPKQLWMPEGAGHCEARYASDQEFKAQVLSFFHRWLLGGPDPGFVRLQTQETVRRNTREVTVSLRNHSGEAIPVAISLHRPSAGWPPEEFRVVLNSDLGEQSFTLLTDAPFEFMTTLRHYKVDLQGASWIESYSRDAQGWRKFREAELFASQGRHEEAEASYTEAQRLAPENPRYSFEAGAYYFRRGLYDRASEAFFRVMATPQLLAPGPDPRQWTALAFVYTGQIFDHKGDRNGALNSYRQAMAFDIPLATHWAKEGISKPYKPPG